MIGRVTLDDVRVKLDQQKKRFDNDQILESDYLESPAWTCNRFPSETIDLLQESGGYAEYIRNAKLTSDAVKRKRAGDLYDANQKYMDIVRSGTKLTRSHIWPWCKILILAKNFDDLKYLVEYLYSYNACYNRLCVKRGYDERFEHYRLFGIEPPMDCSCDAGNFLRELCNDSLISKIEIEQRFAPYGGSDVWSDYRLTNSEFENFKYNFGMPQSKTKGTTQSAASNTNPSTSSFGGCYVATCVYGSYECPEVWILRRYRDKVLVKSVLGRLFIKMYYRVSPHAVEAFGSKNGFKNFNKRILDTVVARLQAKGFKNTPYDDAL